MQEASLSLHRARLGGTLSLYGNVHCEGEHHEAASLSSVEVRPTADGSSSSSPVLALDRKFKSLPAGAPKANMKGHTRFSLKVFPAAAGRGGDVSPRT